MLDVTHEDLQMFANMSRAESIRLLIVSDEPFGMAVARNEQEFKAVLWSAEVFDIRASQTTAAHDAVFRRARPSALDRHGTHSSPQGDLPANHARVAA